jgi:hypothetical protein
LSGVNIQYSQYLDAIGEHVNNQKQNQNIRIHFVYIKHEILNLLSRKNYWKHFKYNIFHKNREFSVYDNNDIKPFIYDLKETIKGVIIVCLKLLKIR